MVKLARQYLLRGVPEDADTAVIRRYYPDTGIVSFPLKFRMAARKSDVALRDHP